MIYTLSELSYKCDECNSPLPFTMLWTGLTVNYILIFFFQKWKSVYFITHLTEELSSQGLVPAWKLEWTGWTPL